MPKRHSTFTSGVSELLILRLLSAREMYGYELAKAVQAVTRRCMDSSSKACCARAAKPSPAVPGSTTARRRAVANDWQSSWTSGDVPVRRSVPRLGRKHMPENEFASLKERLLRGG